MAEYKIPLSGKNGKGKYAIVDREDFEKFGHLKWYMHSNGYAYRIARKKDGTGDSGTQLMHRYVMRNWYGAFPAKGKHTHHVNDNRLDNRRCNLKVISPSENIRAKRGLWSNNTTGYRNVSYCRFYDDYVIYIHNEGARYYGGRHKDIEDAVRAARTLRLSLGVPLPEDMRGVTNDNDSRKGN